MRSFAVVPAAGASQRMGRQKLLLPWGETTLVQRVVRAWLNSRVTRVVMTLRPDDEELASACARFDIDLVRPPRPPPEMKDSVACAVAHVGQTYAPMDEDVWLLAPADLPHLSSTTIDRLLAAALQKPGRILVPAHGGMRGHPVVFPWRLAAEVATIPAGQGIAVFTQRERVVEVPCAADCVAGDVDTPEDYERHVREHGATP